MSSPRLNLLCLGGSLRPISYSLAACRAAAEIANVSGIDTIVVDPRELDLPMYVPDRELDDYAPRDLGVRKLIEAFRWAHAMIWVSPTYHGTVTGVFKNAIDFAELLSGDTPPYLQGRPVGLVSINDSTTFSAMRDCARELRAWVAPTQVELTRKDFDADLRMVEGKSKGRLARLVEELASFEFARPPIGG